MQSNPLLPQKPPVPLRAIIPAGAYLAVIVLACLALTVRAPAHLSVAGVLLGIVTLAQTIFAMAVGFRRLADPIPRINLLVLIAISCLTHALLGESEADQRHLCAE